MIWYMPWDAMFFSHIGIIFRSKQLNIFDWAVIFPQNTHFTLNICLPNTKTLIRICAHLFWQLAYRNFIGNTLDLRLFCIKLQSCYATTHVAVCSCSAHEVGFAKRYCLLLDRLNSDIDVENIHESYAFCIRTIIWHGFEMWDTPPPPTTHHPPPPHHPPPTPPHPPTPPPHPRNTTISISLNIYIYIYIYIQLHFSSLQTTWIPLITSWLQHLASHLFETLHKKVKCLDKHGRSCHALQQFLPLL